MPASKKITGVYAIRNKINTKLYIGSTAEVGVNERWRVHIQFLRKNQHYARHLQYAWNKYGADAFEFMIVEECAPEDCLVLEQYYMDYYDVCNRSCGYNTCPIAGSMLGFKHTEETRARMSEAQKGRTFTEESRRRMSESAKGRKRTEETRRKISEARKGYVHSEEARKKMSDAQRLRRSTKRNSGGG